MLTRNEQTVVPSTPIRAPRSWIQQGLEYLGFNQLRHNAATYPKNTLLFIASSLVVALLASRAGRSKTAYAAMGAAAYQLMAFLVEYSRFLPIDLVSTKDQTHFEPKEVRDPNSNQLLGDLSYFGNCPVLTLQTRDPYLQGRAVALATPKTNALAFKKFYRIATPILKLLHNLQRMGSGSLPLTFAEQTKYIEEHRQIVTIPPKITEEIKGFTQAHNQLIAENGWPYWFAPPPITEEELEDLIRIPDLYKMMFGCSLAFQETDSGFELVRAFDFEMAGWAEKKAAYVIVKPTPHTEEGKPHWTMSFTHAPGFIRVTLLNDKGLFIAINEATTMRNKRHYKGGLPELVMAQEIAENCNTVEQAIAFIRANPPATSHMLTAVDRKDRVCVQLLPPGTDELFILHGRGKEKLAVTNHMYDERGEAIPESDSWGTSRKRHNDITEGFKRGASIEEHEKTLSVPQTAHSVVLKYSRPEDAEVEEERGSPGLSTTVTWGGATY